MVKLKKKLIVEIDFDLHKEFKKTCAIKNDSMSSIVKNAILKYIADHRKNVIY
uniref:Uncharacterized protein n=1 Tax=viral metagenome TaxID=1070528 RepID=A0A6M3X5E9_9ZZZZ